MRKTLFALSALPLIALATPASAQAPYYGPGYYPYRAAPWVAGAAAGTAVGLGLSQGWYTGSFASTLPASAAGAAATGFVAGVGTIALIDAATQPCAGFRALFSPFLIPPGQSSGCVNGRFVGYERTARPARVVERTGPRRRY